MGFGPLCLGCGGREVNAAPKAPWLPEANGCDLWVMRKPGGYNPRRPGTTIPCSAHQRDNLGQLGSTLSQFRIVPFLSRRLWRPQREAHIWVKSMCRGLWGGQRSGPGCGVKPVADSGLSPGAVAHSLLLPVSQTPSSTQLRPLLRPRVIWRGSYSSRYCLSTRHSASECSPVQRRKRGGEARRRHQQQKAKQGGEGHFKGPQVCAVGSRTTPKKNVPRRRAPREAPAPKPLFATTPSRTLARRVATNAAAATGRLKHQHQESLRQSHPGPPRGLPPPRDLAVSRS